MKNPLVTFACLAALVLTLLPGCDDIQYDLQITLDKAMEAQFAGNGAAYLEVLDPQDIEQYDRLLEAARSATREQIGRMQAVDRFVIATVRTELSGRELRNLDARGMIEASPPRWDPGERRPLIEVGTVRHRAPRASAELIVNGHRTNEWVEFVKIEDKWYFSDRAFDRWFNETVRDMALRMNRSEDYVVLMFASAATGRRIDDRVWDAPPR